MTGQVVQRSLPFAAQPVTIRLGQFCHPLDPHRRPRLVGFFMPGRSEVTAMRISLSILGTEVLAIDTGATEVYDEPGDCTTYPVGFVPANEIPDMAGPYREGWE